MIKEGAEYAVELKFSVNHDVVTGLRYIQVVRRAGINGRAALSPLETSLTSSDAVDKLESMIGSYGPSADAVTKRFVTEEA